MSREAWKGSMIRAQSAFISSHLPASGKVFFMRGRGNIAEFNIDERFGK